MFLPLLTVLVQALSGAPVDALQAPAGTKAIVFIFTSTDCPISNRYAPEVKKSKLSGLTDTARKHWAYQLPARYAFPLNKNHQWCRTPIDNFILRKLEEKGILRFFARCCRTCNRTCFLLARPKVWKTKRWNA